MPFDGFTVAAVTYELDKLITGGRIDKIYQPEKDEIVIAIRGGQSGTKRLIMSANASHPRLHLTEKSKTNPQTAPLFCMVLRKHLLNGRILSVTQQGLERVVELQIESFNELGDMTVKRLIIEIMGKHSNIMLVGDDGTVLESIKHINHTLSSVREVLPGKPYIEPPTQQKADPLVTDRNAFLALLKSKPGAKVSEAIYTGLMGISPFLAAQICVRAGINPDTYAEELVEQATDALFGSFKWLVGRISSGDYNCGIILDKNRKPMEFFCVDTTPPADCTAEVYDSISRLLDSYYDERDQLSRMSQKSADLRKLIQLNIERCVKKAELYRRTLSSIEGRDKKRLYGELITANIYNIERGMTSYTTMNFYDEAGGDITIPLDPTLTPSENAQRYFKRYNKEKRTFGALTIQIEENDREHAYLDTVLNALSSCKDEADLADIRDELYDSGYVKKRSTVKGQKPAKSKPLHFVTSDGFHIYVGKNNRQNDELTLRFADNGDIWFHTKEIPGSHVILKTDAGQPTDSAKNEAANLAAFYSKAREGSLVPVDYVIRKHVKKPSGAKPGMVIYDNYKTAYVTPSEEAVKALTEVR